MTLDQMPDLMTPRQVAEILRVSTLTVKRWGKRGEITEIRIHPRGDCRYRKADIKKLLNI